MGKVTRRPKSEVVNLFLGLIFFAFGVYVLMTGNIKNMQLGSERAIPAGVLIIFGIWILVKSGVIKRK